MGRFLSLRLFSLCRLAPFPCVQELFCPMPIVHFKPAENKKKAGRGVYVCPLYMYPVRTGTRERPSFMIPVELKSGSMEPEFWVKRGTALLLSLSS
jgi:dynein heavy chain